MMSGFGQHGFTAGTNSQGSSGPPVSGGTYTSNLEELSHAIRKPLPLRQQTDKATLRYTGAVTGGTTSVPLMLTGHGRPAAVPLFSHSDIQYLRQQVQQYSTPPGMLNNVLFTSFVNKPLPTNSPNSLYTHTITNAPISNINVSVQQPPAQPVPPSSAASRNPYARPISAQEIQPPDSLSSLGGLLMQSSSNSSMGSTGSPVIPPSTTGAYSGSSNVYSSASNPGTQTNVFMKPQATLLSNGSIYKSEKRSTHSTISVKKNKLGSVIYRPSSMTPPETVTSVISSSSKVDGEVGGCNTTICNLQPTVQQAPDDTVVAQGEHAAGKPSHLVVNAVIKSSSNSSSMTVTVPRPPSATKRTAVRPASKAVSPVIPRSQSLVVCPEAYGFVTNIPDHPGPKVQGKPSSVDPKKISKHGGSSPEAGRKELITSSNKLMTNMIPKSSIPRPGTAARSRPGSACSRPEESPSQIRNLNYTPTKPYHEVNNNNLNHADSTKNGSSQQQIAPVHTTRGSPPERDEQANKGLNVNHKPPLGPSNSKTSFYHKTSKTEIVLHRPAPRRPTTEGAAAPAQHSDRPQHYTAPGNEEEWQDEEEDNEDSIQGERQPGDGEDDSDDDDDDEDDDDDDDDDVGFEDDGIDDLDDDLADESDEDSCDVSRGGSATSRVTTLRIRSATKRLLGLTLRDKDKTAAGRAARPTTGRTRPVSAVSTLSSNSDLLPALTASLFPNVPPTINFVNVGEKVEQLPWEIRKLFKWRMSPITPNVVKNCIGRSGFRPSKRNHDWLGYWGKHMKAQGFKAVREYQKVNHFPGSFQIGRKDRLWRNLSRLQVQYGKKEFSFFPQTFVLPPDIKQLKRAFEDGGNKQKWIIKPPASARGIGIRVIHKWNQIPRKRAVIVQRYLSRPYLINDSKFDLRIYVYVTSYDPLRIYVYEDGLVRFASCKYSQAMKNLSNKYMHLTNYSINKKNNEYQSNSDDSVCQGHKWSLKALWGYMKKQGINTNTVWQSMLDLIVKTIISSESAVNSLVKANVRRRYSCNELFGFDIMLDDMLKPWIIEVNISPSLHSNSQLDISVKGSMIKDLMNLAGFRIPAKNDITPSAGSPPEAGSKFLVPPEICTDWRLHPTQMSSDEKAKHAYFCQRANDEQAQQTLLDILTPDDVRILTETIDEESRRGSFVRAFPHFHSHKYLRFFEQPRYYNLLLDCWVHRYHRMEPRGILHLERLCSQGLHLENPTDDLRHQWAPPASLSSLDSRGATSASAMLKGSPNTNLPKLKKRVVKARPVHSVTGGSSSTSSTMSIASSDCVSATSAPPGRGGTS